jgi:hypothetical protein
LPTGLGDATVGVVGADVVAEATVMALPASTAKELVAGAGVCLAVVLEEESAIDVVTFTVVMVVDGSVVEKPGVSPELKMRPLIVTSW